MSLFHDIIVFALAFLGGLTLLLAAVGCLRFPDVFSRMHAASKGGTLGVGFLLSAVALDRLELTTTLHAVLVFLFLLVTAPVGVHMLARAAHAAGVPLVGRYEGERPPEAEAEALPREAIRRLRDVPTRGMPPEGSKPDLDPS